MKLRCQLKGAKCPPYKHQGRFHPDNETLKRFKPDLQRCAACMAFAPPGLPSFQDDLLQIASLTLVEKGPEFTPGHASGASFGSFIRPRICGHLMNAKKKELTHFRRYLFDADAAQASQDTVETEVDRDVGVLSLIPDAQPNFEKTVIWEMWHADFERALPQLLQQLTPRERQVFNLIRADTRHRDIAKTLNLSKGRISQLTQQIELKLRRESQKLGLVEQIP